ncbi:MAG: hypothetical protein ACT4QF_01850 [Sporichthyaceae bacterium]
MNDRRYSDGPPCVACGSRVRATRTRPVRNEHVDAHLLDCTLTHSQYSEQAGGARTLSLVEHGDHGESRHAVRERATD